MTLEFSPPGVFIRELPTGSHAIAGVATSITAFVGYLRRGPASLPAGQAAIAVPLQSFGDFQRIFGGIDAHSETSYQVNQFFLNGGATAWVTRVFGSSADDAPILPMATLNGPSGAPAGGAPGALAPPQGVDTLHVMAANPGSWGQNVCVTIDPPATVGGGFNLRATEYDFSGPVPAALQAIALNGVVMDPARPNYVVRALQDSGNPFEALIALEDQAAAGSPAPFPCGTLLAFQPPAPDPAPPLSFTLTLQPPAPAPTAADPQPQPPPARVLTPIVTTLPVKTAADLLAALQIVFAAAVTQAAELASFHISLVPMPPPAGASAAPPSPPAILQIVLTDPSYAGYLIAVDCEPKLFTLNQTNVQAYRLAASSSDPASALARSPDGKPPSGTDLAGDPSIGSGIHALDKVDLINILCLPDLRNLSAGDYVIAATGALGYCLGRRAMAILDIPSATTDVQAAENWITRTVPNFGAGIINGAAYFPELVIPDPANGALPRTIGASGSLAGIYAATDQTAGAWKAPAEIESSLTGVLQLTRTLSDADNASISPYGLNALRTFPIYGNVVWGAHTLAAGNETDQDWKYVPVRRLALYIEESITRGLKWAVFEPNGESLWAQIRLSVASFLHGLYLQSAFAGAAPDTAYGVICDASITTPDDIEHGIVNIQVMFAPVAPAEFVVIRIAQIAGQSAN